ncbi:hypothetical protein J6590_003084 [Homalodisca vitripennis]|nr:hypothetical protein J6590_003084 [Homalodisca vitripennis]
MKSKSEEISLARRWISIVLPVTKDDSRTCSYVDTEFEPTEEMRGGKRLKGDFQTTTNGRADVLRPRTRSRSPIQAAATIDVA